MIAFVDIETGGFSKEKNAICSIGIVIVDDNLNIIDKYYAVIKPYLRECGTELCSYKDDAMAVNGLTMEEIEGYFSSKIDDVMEFIPYFINNCTHIAGHNLRLFDLPWLNYLMKRFTGADLNHLSVIDTKELSRSKGHFSNDLASLCAYYNISIKNHHNSLADAIASYELYKKLKL